MSESGECCCCPQVNKNNTNNGYRRTIRNNAKVNNWNSRNSSVQVNAVLTPDIYEDTKSECSCNFVEAAPDEVTKTTGKIKWATGNKKSRYHQKCFPKKPKPKLIKPTIKRNITSTKCNKCNTEPSRAKFKNECYCCYPPDKPFLPVRPAVTQPDHRRINRNQEPDEEESTHTLHTLRKAKTLLHDYAPESEFLKRLQREAKEVYDCKCDACKAKEEIVDLKFTRHRELLEEAYADIERNKQYSLDEIARQCHKCEVKSCSCKCGKCSPENNSIKSQNISQNSSSLLDCDKINKIKQIRNNFYFETHSTNVKLAPENIPEHKCVHKFTLDNRLLPKPLNADGFGVSRCTICNKPMENNSVGKTNEGYGGKKQMPLDSPRKINFATRNDVVELQVPAMVVTERKNVKINKMMAPTNSWALRYQKGVV